MDKPTVRYSNPPGYTIKRNSKALIFTIDHPHCSNTGLVGTTQVISVDIKDGEVVGFETLNSKYVRDEDAYTRIRGVSRADT